MRGGRGGGGGERERGERGEGDKDACTCMSRVSLPGLLVGVPIYTRFVLAATKGASGRLDEGAEPGVRGEEGG